MRTMKTVWTSLCLLASTAASAQQYVISTIAGGAPPATPAPGLALTLGLVLGVVADDGGNLYLASADLNAVFRLDSSGVLTRVAGNSRTGYSGDGGPATNARITSPKGLALDAAGNLFVADYGNRRIRRVSRDGIITTVAGSGACCFSGDGGPAVNAALATPLGLSVDAVGNLFIADEYNHRVRKVSTSGIITTVAGNGIPGFSGDGGPGDKAQLSYPTSVAADRAGNLYIADYNNHRIRMLSADGILTTAAGNGVIGSSGDDGPATDANLIWAVSIGVDGADNLYIADSGSVRKVSGGKITTVAGGGTSWGPSSDGAAATSAAIQPRAIAADEPGNLFIADAFGNSFIHKVSSNGTITTVAGNPTAYVSGDGGRAVDARLENPGGVAIDRDGNFYIVDVRDIRKVSVDGSISTVAPGCGGPDDYDTPCGIAVDTAGNLYVSDEFGVRKISPSGATTKVSSTPSYGIAVDTTGNLYMSDQFSCQIRRFSTAGTMTVVAGNGSCGYSGDGGMATAAQIGSATAMNVDRTGSIYFVEGDARIRKVSPEGIITTIAGGGPGELADGSLATSGGIRDVIGLATDSTGSVFYQEFSAFNQDDYPRRLRKISPGGIVTTIAGTGSAGYSGDAGPAILAQLNPRAEERGNNLSVDSAGNVYVADAGNHAIRVLRPVHEPLVIGSVVDAASQDETALSPGMIVVIYGAGLGPSQLTQNEARNGQLGTAVGSTQVAFDGIAAPILYTSWTQVAAVVPYAITGTTAQVTVTYLGQNSAPLGVPVMPSSPGVFTLNQTGAGQAAAINAVDGTANTAANPVKIGAYISLYATGEGQTIPAGVDGRLSSTSARPVFPVSVTVAEFRRSCNMRAAHQGKSRG